MTTTNILILQGATFDRSIALTDETGNPLDVTGFRAAANLKRDPYSNTISYPFEVNLTTGNLELRMEANTTILLTPGTWQYDVLMTNGTDYYRIMEGLVEVSSGVTLTV